MQSIIVIYFNMMISATYLKKAHIKFVNFVLEIKRFHCIIEYGDIKSNKS